MITTYIEKNVRTEEKEILSGKNYQAVTKSKTLLQKPSKPKKWK